MKTSTPLFSSSVSNSIISFLTHQNAFALPKPLSPPFTRRFLSPLGKHVPQQYHRRLGPHNQDRHVPQRPHAPQLLHRMNPSGPQHGNPCMLLRRHDRRFRSRYENTLHGCCWNLTYRHPLVHAPNIANPNPKSISLLLPAFWALLWNGLGAGWILPLGIYFHLQAPTSSTTPTQTIPLPHAKALLPTMTITSYLTAAIMFLSPPPSSQPAPSNTKPSSPGSNSHPSSPQSSKPPSPPQSPSSLPLPHQTVNHETHQSRTLTRTSLLLSALFSASIHLYCLLTTTLLSSPTSAPLTTFPRVYIPAPKSVQPNSADIIAQGAALFMRYDNIIINATCALLCYMVMSPHLDSGAQQGSKMGLAVGIAVATFLLGPGAVGSLGFWWREGKGSYEEGLVGEEKSMRG
ncbi:hypothetical protein XPA_005292 [Xanthoria parietina]